MRTALLAVAAVAAGGLVVPVAIAAAGTPDAQPPAAVEYRDPALASAATVSVSGTLTPIHNEAGRDLYAVSLPNGDLVPVSLHRLGEDDLDRPRPFRGDLALPAAVADRAEARGASIDAGDDIDGRTSEGKVVIAAATTATSPLPVESATLGDEPTQSATTAQAATAHRLYIAVVTNRGTLESSSSISSKTASMRSYWTTQADGKITSFTQPTATQSLALSSSSPTTAQGCGLANPSPVWKEAAAKFSGVNFADPGNHLMVIVPDQCGDAGAAGIGTVGSSLSSGGRTIVTLGDTSVAIGVHELGHNLSLSHANAERCSSSCATSEYWDLYSIMGLAVGGGSWSPASLDSYYRVQTGIADSSEVPTLTRTTTLHLAGRGTTSGTRGALVTDPSTNLTYSIEYRSGTGRDSNAFYAPGRTINNYVYRPGIVIERIEDDESTTMITRASGSNYLTSWVAGERFSRGKLTVAVTDATPADGADVTVTLPAPTTTPTPTPTTSTAASTSADPGLPSLTATPTDPTDVPTDPTATPSDTPSETPSASPSSTPPATFAPGTPGIYGVPRVGRQLAVTSGEWSPRPQYFTAQWYADGRPIARANGARLGLTRSLLGARITVRLTGYREGYTAASRTSAATSPVQAGRFTSRTVRITGHAKVGRRLAAVTGTWDPRPTFSYRWYANGRTIKGATGRTLKITKSLRGKRIAVRITARQDGYRSTTRASTSTSSVH